MTQAQQMRKALLASVVPNILREGFTGEYPHFRRTFADRIEIISFAPYKYGNAFFVDISTAYLRAQNTNTHSGFNGNFNTITTSDCRKIYRLKGNFDEKFFYTDVYFCWAHYIGVGENNKSFKPMLWDIRVQKAGPDIYQKVCDKVNKQMQKAYKWFDKMSKR